MTPRKAQVDITYIQKGSSANSTASAIATYEENFSYVDAATGESDTMSLKVCNQDLRWANLWMPEKGDKMTAKIRMCSWDKLGDQKTFDCGKFCCDDLSLSGPTLICTIGGTSVPENQSFRSTKRSYTWQDATIYEIAKKIAENYSLTLYYDAGDINISSLEQNEETDCSFLNNLCGDYGLNIKVYYGKIIIYDVDAYESKEAVAAYDIKDFADGWYYNSTLTGTYTGATIQYTNGDSDEELTLTVGTSERLLNVNEKVDSEADALLKACAMVNKENRNAVTMTATIRANPKIAASACITVTGAYNLNGKYFIDKVTHNIDADGAYTMDLEMHQVQDKIKTATTASSAKSSAAA